MIDPRLVKLRQEELLREAETNRQSRALRAPRKRSGSRRVALTWEIKRHAGRLDKLLKTLRRAG